MKKNKAEKKNTGTKPGAILHGECMIVEVAAIPADAVIEKRSNDCHIIIAPSEVTGNHHVIDNKKENDFYTVGEGPKAKRYLNAKVPTTVRCAVADRHTEVPIAPGIYEIGFQQEYDYITEAKRNVRD